MRGPHLGEPGEPQALSGTQPGSPDTNNTDPPTCNITIVPPGGWTIKPPGAHNHFGGRAGGLATKQQHRREGAAQALASFLPPPYSSRSSIVLSIIQLHSAGLGVLSLRRAPNLGMSGIPRPLMPTPPLESTGALEPPPLFSHPLASAVHPQRQLLRSIFEKVVAPLSSSSISSRRGMGYL